MFRLHFTDAALAKMEQLGLDQDEVRTVIVAGPKRQLDEGNLVCRHKGTEVEVRAEGADYTVTDVRREAAWPRGPPTLGYARKMGSA